MSATAMKEFVQRFTASGGRQVGTAGHAEARRMIDERLMKIKEANPAAPLQPYAGDSFVMRYAFNGASFANVIARIKTTSNKNPILIGAHFDTCGHQSGADDNAAAVAIVFNILERLLENENWKRLGGDVVFAFFDAEEPPNFVQRSMGSIRFYEAQRSEDFALAIIMDLVGHDVPVTGLEKLVAAMGMESHPSLEKLLNDVDTGKDIGLVAIQNRFIGDLSDHHIFRVNGVPFLFFSCGHWQHYHQVTDTWEKLNYNKMEAIASYLYNLILTYSNYDFTDNHQGYDPTQTELKLMNRSLEPLLRAKGISELKSKEEMERVVGMLLSFGL